MNFQQPQQMQHGVGPLQDMSATMMQPPPQPQHQNSYNFVQSDPSQYAPQTQATYDQFAQISPGTRPQRGLPRARQPSTRAPVHQYTGGPQPQLSPHLTIPTDGTIPQQHSFTFQQPETASDGYIYQSGTQSVGDQLPVQQYNFAPYQHPDQLTTATPPQSYTPSSEIASSWGGTDDGQHTVAFAPSTAAQQPSASSSLNSVSARASPKTANSGKKAQDKSSAGRKGQGKKRARADDALYAHDSDSASDDDDGFGMINVNMPSMAGRDSRPTRLYVF